MSLLFTPVKTAKLELKNRVVVAPMCMYEVKKKDGLLTPFHLAHYGSLAIGQAGLIILEATAVQPDGRLTDFDLGLWNLDQAQLLTKLVADLHQLGTKVGIQLNHSGRKGQDALHLVAPSAIAYNTASRTPAALSVAEIKEIQQAFVQAAKRAAEAGVDMIELHGAHGYLIHQFLSPSTNQRTDEYGGNLENRYRFLAEMIAEIRQFYQSSLWVRLSLTDYAPTGEQNSMTEWQTVARWLEQAGIDCIDVSTGGLLDRAPAHVYPGYQVSYTRALKEVVKIPVTAVGLLDQVALSEYLLQSNQADLILIGRGFLRNPQYLTQAAKELHEKNFAAYNHSYLRARN